MMTSGTACVLLADHDVARGYGDGTFQPLGNVLQAQAISLFTRAMVGKGYCSTNRTIRPSSRSPPKLRPSDSFGDLPVLHQRPDDDLQWGQLRLPRPAPLRRPDRLGDGQVARSPGRGPVAGRLIVRGGCRAQRSIRPVTTRLHPPPLVPCPPYSKSTVKSSQNTPPRLSHFRGRHGIMTTGRGSGAADRMEHRGSVWEGS